MVATLGLLLAPAVVHAAEVSWIAPEHESAIDGPFGVLFVPRYPAPDEAHARSEADIRQLEQALTEFDDSERARAAKRIADRLAAVEHWEGVLMQQLAEAEGPAARRLRAQHLVLEIEANTLQAQQRLVGVAPPSTRSPRPPIRPQAPVAAKPPTSPKAPLRPRDVVQFGERVHVPADVTVRDAVAFGEDVVVEGRVLSDAVSFGGDVHIRGKGEVLGDAVSFGGSVELDDDAHVGRQHLSFGGPLDAFSGVNAPKTLPSAPSLWSRLRGVLVFFLSLAGAGILTLGLAPQRVDRAARTAGTHPWLSLFVGGIGSLGILVGALLFAITVVGIPLSLALLAGWGVSALVGFVGLCQALGDRLPVERQVNGRWIAFGVGTGLLSLAYLLPYLGTLIVAAAFLTGTGATVLSWRKDV